ncbi:MAG: hypothetical protein WCO02_04865 [Bacteroidota bacterium]
MDFNEVGAHSQDGKLFITLVREWEVDFNERYFPLFSNYFYGNASTMILLQNCFVLEPDEDFGMELIDGKIDLDTNLEIENYSKRRTTYALGSKNDEDEPLFFIRDERMVDGMAILKYIPERDDDDTLPTPEPEHENKKVTV